MKRLFKLMKGMREDTSAYTAMYDGTVFIPQPGDNPDKRSRDTLGVEPVSGHYSGNLGKRYFSHRFLRPPFTLYAYFKS